MGLKDYLDKHKISMAEAAKALGLSYELIRRYCNGMSIPRRETLLKICTWSGGKVRPSDFYEEPKER